MAKLGSLHQVTDEIYKPNGVCFSPDYKILYAADTGRSHYPEAPSVIKAWDVIDEARLANGRDFASMELDVDGELRVGGADGIRCDAEGNLWSSAGWAGGGLRRRARVQPGRCAGRANPVCRRCVRTCVSAGASETGCS